MLHPTTGMRPVSCRPDDHREVHDVLTRFLTARKHETTDHVVV